MTSYQNEWKEALFEHLKQEKKADGYQKYLSQKNASDWKEKQKDLQRQMREGRSKDDAIAEMKSMLGEFNTLKEAYEPMRKGGANSVKKGKMH